VNILALTSSYPRYDGDPTVPFVESMVEHVAGLGHGMHVVLPENRRWNRPLRERGVTYHPYRYSPRRSWTPWGYSESLQRGVSIRPILIPLAPVVMASALRTAGRLLERERFDVVHAHWLIPNGPISARAASRHRVPFVVSLHGSDMAVAERVRLLGRVARRTLAKASAVTAPSEDLLERAERLGAKGRLELLPYGVDPDALTAAPEAVDARRAELGLGQDAVVVAGIGRFIAVKGFAYLVDAFAQARASDPSLHLLLIGDGDLRGELEARVQSLDITGDVTFTGMADRNVLPSLLGLADIVAVPSIRYNGLVDGLPNVALEAMGVRKPLVATRVGGLPEVVRDDETGLLVEEKDVPALASAILRLAGDPQLRARLGTSAEAEIRAERSWEVVARRLVEVYEAVAA
jgi:glycosyltransferase involved in cell wall biosynthesis